MDIMSRPFEDIVDRPPIELSGRFTDRPAPARVYTLEEIAARNAELNAAHPAILPTVNPVVPAAAPPPVAVPDPKSDVFQDAISKEEPVKTSEPPPIKPKRKSKPGVQSVDPAAVAKLKSEGLGNSRIAKRLGASKSAVQRVASKMPAAHFSEAVAPSAAVEPPLTTTERRLVELALRAYGPHHVTDNADEEKIWEDMGEATYMVQSERDAALEVDRLMERISCVADARGVLLEICTAKRRLEFELIDATKRCRDRDPYRADAIESLLPATDRERLEKGREAESPSK